VRSPRRGHPHQIARRWRCGWRPRRSSFAVVDRPKILRPDATGSGAARGLRGRILRGVSCHQEPSHSRPAHGLWTPAAGVGWYLKRTWGAGGRRAAAGDCFVGKRRHRCYSDGIGRGYETGDHRHRA
jgi:hypothetical protein